MTWWHYLLLSNLYLVLFYGFYLLLLRRETFFQLNRIYLVSAAVMAFLIPGIHVDWVQQWFITQKVHQTIYSAGPGVIFRLNAVQPQHITMGELLGGIYVAGILVLTIKLIWQLFTLNRIMQNSHIAAAWSFFKKIKVAKELQHHEVIMAHEEVHARQWHSADVLLIEFIMIVNWFNPVVYFYRRSVKQIHEFIADRDALKCGTSKADYAMLLVSQTFNAPVHNLLNPFFNNSVLKQRIIMLQRSKSGYAALIKYGFSAPLFALMLALSSATINNSQVVKNIHTQAEEIFTTAAPSIMIDEPTITPTAQSPRAEELKAVEPGFKTNTNLLVTDEPQTRNAPLPADSVTTNDHAEVFTSVEKLPEFPGGVQSFYHFLQKNLRYPAEALQNNKQGRVNVTFVVKSDGALADIKVLNHGEYGLGQEAARVMSTSPKWIAGMQNGRKVNVQYTVPIVFSIAGEMPLVKNDTATRIKSITFITRSTSPRGISVTDSMHATTAQKFVNAYSFTTADAGTAKKMIVIDGKDVSGSISLDKINPDDIKSIDVYKRNDASMPAEYKANRDVIKIVTKSKPTTN